MTLFNVHIYREMRLFFPGIEAATPDEAARLAADKPTPDAGYTEDCDGESLAALVDVIGDDEFEHSVTIDFEPERARKSAPILRAALAWLATVTDDLDAAIDGVTTEFNAERAEVQIACRNAHKLLDDTLRPSDAPLGRVDVHELLKERRQVAVIWSVEDVQAVRPDLTDDQAWDVLQRCEKAHDCDVGFTWLLIETVADELFPQPLSTKE